VRLKDQLTKVISFSYWNNVHRIVEGILNVAVWINENTCTNFQRDQNQQQIRVTRYSDQFKTARIVSRSVRNEQT
jgi:glucose uptake protein GlcU